MNGKPAVDLFTSLTRLEAAAEVPVAPVYLIYGEGSKGLSDGLRFWIRRWLKALAARWLGTEGEFGERLHLSGETVEFAAVRTYLATPSLFAMRRLAVLEETRWRTQAADLAAYLRRPAPDAVLVVIEGRLPAALAELEAAWPAGARIRARAPAAAGLRAYWGRRAQALGIEFTREGWEYFLAVTEDNPWQCEPELEKLWLYGQAAKERGRGRVRWDAPALAEVLADPVEAEGDVFRLIDAVAARDLPTALALLRSRLHAGDEPVRLLVTAARQWIALAGAHRSRAPDADHFAKESGLKPYPARRIWQQRGRWSGAELERALKWAARVDGALKASEGEADAWLEVLFSLALSTSP